jgi:hypothetical protein
VAIASSAAPSPATPGTATAAAVRRLPIIPL